MISNPTATTRAELREHRERLETAASRREELAWLIIALVVVAAGLALTFLAKQKLYAPTMDRVRSREVFNLNATSSATELLPYLREIPDTAARVFIASKVYEAVRREHFANVGTLARLRVHEPDMERQKIAGISERLQAARQRRNEREAQRSWISRLLHRAPEADVSVPLLTPREFSNLKPTFIVRTAAEFWHSLLTWTGIFVLVFFAVHFFWRWTGFAGDNTILAMIELLAGIGLMLMISMRDPLRDTMMFADFATGAAIGCVAMALCTCIDYESRARRYSFTFLLGAVVLGLLLASPLGTGPGASDAKVNLFFFQPVEVMRILIVFFLAGYFAENWDLLRDLRQRHALPSVLQRFHVPRLDYVIPVAAGVAVSLLLFFFLRDLGPALVLGCLFLILYSIARKRVVAALCGLGVLILGFMIGDLAGFPETVHQRVEIWASPWRNTVHGGDQIAHSLWTLSSGGMWGAGLGMGKPASLPAGHTDLILSVAGEELGFAGFAAIFAVYGLLLYRCLRIALRAPSAYSFFLTTGLTLAIGLQIVLIAGGLLGLIPLSGVVSPFMSYGKTSMIANFAVFGIILAISASAKTSNQSGAFGVPVRRLGLVLAVCGAAIVARDAWVQIVKADNIAIRDAEVRNADGGLGLKYNPRIEDIVQALPKGSIFDRNGLPIATSDWTVLEQHRADYQRLGINLDQAATRSERRHYPLGPEFFYLVGDVRSTLRQGATNVAFQERLSRIRLQGFDDRRQVIELKDPQNGEIYRVYKYDYSDLAPFLRHPYDPEYPAVKTILSRRRDVHMSIDARLQLRLSAILNQHVTAFSKKGAIVVLEPSTGDLLASVSYPWPEASEFASFRANPDRAMERELQDRARYGLYPPGSSFKVVTVIAALKVDPASMNQHYECKGLGDGRVGNYVRGWRRPIRDDVLDKHPHGSVDMARGITVSCNAYFAQLGTYNVGPQPLIDTAKDFGIDVARPDTASKLKDSLPFASYGQGQVVATPFQMARVAATIAAGGLVPQGRWVTDESNFRIEEPKRILPPNLASDIGRFMRSVVASDAGTGRVLKNSAIPIAGKTGTAELNRQPSHAWFIGFAPYGQTGGKRIAFAVLVENGTYGGRTAAPIAGEIVAAARDLGLL